MENYEYNRVFPFEYEEDEEPDSREKEDIINYIQECKRDLVERPRFLLPGAPVLFEETIANCELIVKEFSGRIKAKIDYSEYTATIELWCLYVDFDRGEFMSILHEITNIALSIRFTPLTTGELHIKIWMPYFLSAYSEEEQE